MQCAKTLFKNVPRGKFKAHRVVQEICNDWFVQISKVHSTWMKDLRFLPTLLNEKLKEEKLKNYKSQ